MLQAYIEFFTILAEFSRSKANTIWELFWLTLTRPLFAWGTAMGFLIWLCSS